MNKQFIMDLIFKTQVGSMSVSKAGELISEAFDAKDDALAEIKTEWMEAVARNIAYSGVLYDIFENHECTDEINIVIKKVMREEK